MAPTSSPRFVHRKPYLALRAAPVWTTSSCYTGFLRCGRTPATTAHDLERLGLPPGKHAVLYAPTSLDDSFYGVDTFRPRRAVSSVMSAAIPVFHDNMEVLAKMLPHARSLTLPGLDHLAPLTHPADIATAIADFIAT
jgi:hypothetical protein